MTKVMSQVTQGDHYFRANIHLKVNYILDDWPYPRLQERRKERKEKKKKRVPNSYEIMTGMEKQRLQEKFAFVHLYSTSNEI